MRRYFIAFVLGLVALAPPAASAQTTLAGWIDSVASEGTLSTRGLSQTISFDVTFTCTAGDFAVVEAQLDQSPGNRRFGAIIQFTSEPTLCTGEPQTLALTETVALQAPFVFVPGTARLFFVRLTVCDPTLSDCFLADEIQDSLGTPLSIRLVPG